MAMACARAALRGRESGTQPRRTPGSGLDPYRLCPPLARPRAHPRRVAPARVWRLRIVAVLWPSKWPSEVFLYKYN